MRVGLMATPIRVGPSYRYDTDNFYKQTGGNSGNLAFVYALFGQLGTNVTILPWHVDPSVARERVDIIIIACANQLGSHTDLGPNADRLAATKLPILAIGLGAQSGSQSQNIKLTDGTRRWVEVIASQSPIIGPNIGTRGQYTLDQLKIIGLGRSGVVTGCPSNFITPDPDLGDKISSVYNNTSFGRLGVAAGLPGWEMLRDVERSLVGLIEQHDGEYIIQSELDMMRLARREMHLIDPSALDKIRDYIKPGFSNAAFEKWCGRYATIYGDADAWMERLRAFDFVVGPRFHGVMFALQAGIPGGVITHDSRTAELCETMGVPHCHWSQMDAVLSIDSIKSTFKFDAPSYRLKRAALAKPYHEMLTASGIQPSAHLAEIALAL